MTGMYNRLGYRKLACCMFEEKKQTGENLSIIFMDMDRLKSINDEFGHIYGDRAIKTMKLPFPLTVSAGCIHTDMTTERDLDDYVREADAIMYEEKTAKKANRT